MKIIADAKPKIFLIIIAAAVILGGWYYYAVKSGNAPGKLDAFAQCLKEKGAVFYGAFWCPHCKNQKTMFGNSQKYLNYVECSTPDGRAQLQACKEKNITGYPTWEFADGSRESGEVPLNKLSEKTGCKI